MLNRLIIKSSKLSPFTIVLLTTIFALLGSVPSVFFITKLYGVEYKEIYIVLSVVLPMMLTPPIISIFIKLSKYLKTFQDELEKEIEKNKTKDLILFEQARFVLMGEMLANISHQWKQPLNIIGLSIVNARFLSGEDLENSFNKIEKNVNYLASTIDDFMSFFDKKTYTQIRDLQNILKEIRTIVQMEIASNDISLEIKVESANGEIYLASSISQVLINLLNNAKDALNENIKEKKISLKFVAKEDTLKIICSDNGKGVSLEIKDKIFDPYFTTKHKSQGTGIGLYMSKQIIQKIFHGSISYDIDSASFCMSIPYSDKCVLKQKGTNIDDTKH